MIGVLLATVFMWTVVVEDPPMNWRYTEWGYLSWFVESFAACEARARDYRNGWGYLSSKARHACTLRKAN